MELSEKTGPGKITRTYLRGETHNFGYVVNAVAYHFGSGDSGTWQSPVEEALSIVTDGVSTGAGGGR